METLSVGAERPAAGLTGSMKLAFATGKFRPDSDKLIPPVPLSSLQPYSISRSIPNSRISQMWNLELRNVLQEENISNDLRACVTDSKNIHL